MTYNLNRPSVVNNYIFIYDVMDMAQKHDTERAIQSKCTFLITGHSCSKFADTLEAVFNIWQMIE